MIQVPLRDVLSPQHVRCMVRNRIIVDVPAVPGMGNQVMDVYTGFLGIRTPREDELVRHEVESLVPLGGGGATLPVQVYPDPGPNADHPMTAAIALVSLSGFAFPPQVAIVARAAVEVRPFEFQGESGQFHFLVLTAQVACQQTNVHTLAYQVTVLTTPTDQNPTSLGPYRALERARRQLDRDFTPETLASA